MGSAGTNWKFRDVETRSTENILPHFANPASYRNSQITIDRAEGVYFWDTSGKRYIDGVAQVMVVNAGHGRKEIIDAMKAQLDRYSYNFLSFSSSPPAID